MPAATKTHAIFGLIADAIHWTPAKQNAESWPALREILKKARDGADLLDIRDALQDAGWNVMPPDLTDEEIEALKRQYRNTIPDIPEKKNAKM